MNFNLQFCPTLVEASLKLRLFEVCLLDPETSIDVTLVRNNNDTADMQKMQGFYKVHHTILLNFVLYQHYDFLKQNSSTIEYLSTYLSRSCFFFLSLPIERNIVLRL